MLHETSETYPFWTERNDDLGHTRIGLSEVFLETLADEIVGFDWLIAQGRARRGEAIALLHTARGSLNLNAPFEMEIVAVNDEVARDPRLLRQSPYFEGWLAEVRRSG